MTDINVRAGRKTLNPARGGRAPLSRPAFPAVAVLGYPGGFTAGRARS